MTTIILFIISYILLGYIIASKQYKASKESDWEEIAIPVFSSFILAPFWLIGAIIRQVFIEDWK